MAINPLSGPAAPSPNGTVTISGTGLGRDVSDRPEVRFNGALATEITALTATSVSVSLPLDASDGPVTLKTLGGMTSSLEAGLLFNVLTPPVIDRVTPNEGPIGTEVKIEGRRFGTNGGNLRRISFEGVNGRVDADKTDSRNTNQVLFTRVPAGAVTGFIRVDNSDGLGFSPTQIQGQEPGGSEQSRGGRDGHVHRLELDG